MAKYEFVSPSDEKGDPLIRRIDSETGIVDFLLIRREGDTIYYNAKGNRRHYDIFRISPYGNDIQSQMCNFPSDDRLRAFSDGDLSRLSQITKIPVDELIEIRDLEREKRNIERPSPAPNVRKGLFPK